MIVNDAVAVAAIFRPVKFSQSPETVAAGIPPVGARRLLRNVAEEFLAAVNLTVMIAVKREESVPRVGRGSGQLNGVPIAEDVEDHAVVCRG